MAGYADYRSIYQKILESEKFQKAAFLRAKLRYTNAKKMFFDDFYRHPISKIGRAHV